MSTEPVLRLRMRLGREVVGEATVEKTTQARRTGAMRFGPLVTEPAVTPEGEPAKPVDANGDGSTSVAELEKALQGNPALFDRLLAAEQARPKPRITALRLFLELERAKAEPRDEVLAELERLIG